MKLWKKLGILLGVVVMSVSHAEMKVLALAGSLRSGSYNKQLLLEATEILKELGGSVTVVMLNDYPMPFYNADLESEEGMPEFAKKLRRQMIDSDAILIASAEYNGSVPAVLKNAIDWASRSEKGKPSYEAFENKRFALISASPGGGGGSRSLAHLRQIVGNLKAQVLEEQTSIPSAHEYFSKADRKRNVDLEKQMSVLIK